MLGNTSKFNQMHIIYLFITSGKKLFAKSIDIYKTNTKI